MRFNPASGYTERPEGEGSSCITVAHNASALAGPATGECVFNPTGGYTKRSKGEASSCTSEAHDSTALAGPATGECVFNPTGGYTKCLKGEASSCTSEAHDAPALAGPATGERISIRQAATQNALKARPRAVHLRRMMRPLWLALLLASAFQSGKRLHKTP